MVSSLQVETSAWVQDTAAAWQEELYGCGSPSKLQVRGTEQKWVL